MKENIRIGVLHMYQAGDRVVYGIHGVCTVRAMEERRVDHKKVRYLVLEPVEQEGATFLVPAENPAAMAKLRPILTRQEVEDILQGAQVRQDNWIADENQRKQMYRELIVSGDREALLQMVATLHRHKKSQQAAGRKFHLCDENFLRDAQRLLNGELSLVLGITPGQVGEYVQKALDA